MVGLQTIYFIKLNRGISNCFHIFTDYDHAYAWCMGECIPINQIVSTNFDARGHLAIY